ncbi:MAG TPA: GNAT family N-acetyltransferase [Candidatus Eisenbacteria bacterium]|nr:GNAT family N-acetyltransferase [Candidatus Eisenbacteria bacterium]
MSDAEILHDTSAAAMAGAAQASLMALNRFLGGSTKTEVHRAPGTFRWQTPVPHPFFNGVVVSEPPGAGAEARARSTLDYFASKGVSAITWWFDPGVSAEAWAPLLLGLGFQFDPNLPGMAAPLDDIVSDAAIPRGRDAIAAFLEIRRVEGSAMLREWTEVFVAGYELPRSYAAPLFDVYDELHGPASPLQSYFAYLDGEPVATSSVFHGAGVAGIYDVATLPTARGRGIGAAVTLAPLLAARARGYRVGVLQSSAKGLRVYERLGFRTVCRIPHFTWTAPA